MVEQSSDDIICVKAKLRLKGTEDGGQTKPISSGYRPNHTFEKPVINKPLSNFFIGEIQLSEEDYYMCPGETKIVTVMFLRAGNIERYMNIGRKWFSYEVPRLVAEAEILEIHYYKY